MAQTIEVVYENGVLRPKEPTALIEGETVDILVLPRQKRRPADSTLEGGARQHRDEAVPEYFDPDAAARLRSLPRPDPTDVARRLHESAALAPRDADGARGRSRTILLKNGRMTCDCW